MNIKIYDVFELNRVLHNLIEQQSSYNIQTAFKIHTLIKWLDDTEKFILERMKILNIDIKDSEQQAFLFALIPFIETTLTIDELLNTKGDVNINLEDVEILEKIFGKNK